MRRHRWIGMMRLFEVAFVLGALLLVIDAALQLVLSGGDQSTIDRSQGYVEYQAAMALVYIVAGTGAVWKHPRVIHILVRTKALTALVLLSIFSIVWSIDPSITLRRSIGLTGTTLFGIYLALRFTPRDFFRLLGMAFVLAAVASLVFVLVVPELGIHQTGYHQGLWRGVFVHKNVMGKMMALGVVVLFLLAKSRGINPILAWGGFVLCAFLLALSGSRSGWIVAGALLVSYPVLRMLRVNLIVAIPAMIFVLVTAGGLGLWVAANTEEVFYAIGRDPTLTGRIPLWIASLRHVAEKPLLGYGFSAFWFNQAGPAATVWSQIGWFAGDAHNSFVDTLLGLGIVGLLLVSGILVHFFWGALRCIRRGDPVLGVQMATMFLYVMWSSSSGTVIPASNSISWLLICVMSSYIALGYASSCNDTDADRELKHNDVRVASPTRLPQDRVLGA